MGGADWLFLRNTVDILQTVLQQTFSCYQDEIGAVGRKFENNPEIQKNVSTLLKGSVGK